MSSDSRIDDAILSVVRNRWQEVAKIIATVVNQRHEQATEEEYDLVASRVVALVHTGKLESQGDLSNRRHSEVRLPT